MKKTIDLMSKTGKWLLVFSFICSNLSFPLEVLAEELIDNENTDYKITDTDVNPVVDESSQENGDNLDEYVIRVNGEETLEYTITDNKILVIDLEYQGEVRKGIEIDFSNKLYGVYEFAFAEVDSKVVINYVGNNIRLLEQYKNVVDTTKNITCNDEECVIGGFGVELVTVNDVLSYYDLEEFEGLYDANVVITNEEGEVLLGTDTLANGYRLEIIDNEEDISVVNTTPVTAYTINRVGDVFVPSDGLVDIKDQGAIVDDILLDNEVSNMNDVNGDGVLNILDATHSTFIDNGLVDEEVIGALTNTLTSSSTDKEVLIGDTIEVKFFVSGFDKVALYGIQGLLTYDDTMLKLVEVKLYEPSNMVLIGEVSDENINLGYLNDNKFAYVLNNGFNCEDALLTLKFEALAAGTSEVAISDIIESYGEMFDSNDSVSVSINVVSSKGGDVENNTPNEDVKEDNITNEENNTIEEDKEEEVTESNPVVRPVVLSSDYYIKNLTINGYELDFDMYTYEYSIKVSNDVDSLDFNVLLNDSNSIYYIEGNDEFKEGENLVYLVVKAQNGSTKTYTIRVEKEKEIKEENTYEDDTLELEEEEEKENSTSKTVIIILIILVIIGLIYVIFKDDEEDTKEIKKEVKKEEPKVEKKKVETVKKNTGKSKNTSKNSSKKNTKKTNKK